MRLPGIDIPGHPLLAILDVTMMSLNVIFSGLGVGYSVSAILKGME